MTVVSIQSSIPVSEVKAKEVSFKANINEKDNSNKTIDVKTLAIAGACIASIVIGGILVFKGNAKQAKNLSKEAVDNIVKLCKSEDEAASKSAINKLIKLAQNGNEHAQAEIKKVCETCNNTELQMHLDTFINDGFSNGAEDILSDILLPLSFLL